MQLVLDWDGTITVRDSLVAAIHALGDPSVYDGGLQQSFSSYGEVRPGFHELVERYQPVVVSSGLPQLILPVLEREGIEVEVRSNDAEVRPDGWRVIFRDEGDCPVCGDKCKRRSLP